MELTVDYKKCLHILLSDTNRRLEETVRVSCTAKPMSLDNYPDIAYIQTDILASSVLGMIYLDHKVLFE